MKFSIKKKELLRVLSDVASIVPTKTTLSTLTNLYIAAKDGKLSLQTTDLDLSVLCWIDANVEEGGELLVNAKKFTEIVCKLPDVVIQIERLDNFLQLSYEETFSCKLPISDTEEFPRLPEYQSSQQIFLNSKELSWLSENVMFAISIDETRLPLKGVFCEARQANLRMVATDGHRLGMAQVPLAKEQSALKAGVILSPKALALANRMLTGAGEEGVGVDLVIGDTFSVFQTPKLVIYSKLIEGSYPNYEQVMPKNNKKKVVFRSKALFSALRRMDVLSHFKTRQVCFKLSENLLELSTVDKEFGGSAQEKISVEYKDEPIEIGFNAVYFMEILRVAQCDEITMSMNTPLSAVTLHPMEIKENHEVVFLIMPLRI